jgi:hypothetical protein
MWVVLRFHHCGSQGIKEPVLMYSHSCESLQKLAKNVSGDSLEIKPQKTGCWPIIRNRTKTPLDSGLSFDTCDFQKN